MASYIEKIKPGTVTQIPIENFHSEAEKNEVKRLRLTHELYDIYDPDWKLYLAAFEGGSAMACEANLWQHFRENDEDYRDRIARLHYMNYCKPLVKFYTNFIFTETIQRNGGANDAWYQDFVKNVDRKGTPIDEFMQNVTDDDQVVGMLYVLVDAPPAPTGLERPLTVQDERDLKISPYWVLIRADEILDWVTDEFDNLKYLKRKQSLNTLEGRERKKIERFTEWYPDAIETSEIDNTDPRNPVLRPKQTVKNSLGYLPFVVLRYERSKIHPYMGNSFLIDFAANNREIMNQTSLLQEFLYRQCFNVLAKETDGQVPTRDQEDQVLSSNNVLDVPKGAAMPQYISPPSDPAKFVQSERDYIKQEMFRRAAQDALNEMFNGEGASGFSQAQSFSKTVPFISTLADSLERTEHQLMTMTLDRLGKQWDGKIKYKDRYELTNLTDAITQLSMLAKDLQIVSPTFFKEEMKRLIAEYDGKIPVDLRNKIISEIDAMDMKSWQETQKQALIGQPKTPAGQQKDKSTGTMAEAAAESNNTPAATKKTQ